MTLGSPWHPQLGKAGRCVSGAALSDSAKLCPFPTGAYVGCIMQFSRIISSVDLQIWNASSNGFSFVISFESRNGSGLRGRLGFVASWRPIYQNRSAIKVGGLRRSPRLSTPARPCSCT